MWGPQRTLLLGAENTDGTVTGVTTGTSKYLKSPGFGIVSFYFRSSGTTSGGTILIEEADWDENKQAPFSGTWSSIASVSASSFTGTAQVAYHVTNCAYGYLRVRISSDITGGGSILVSCWRQGGSI